MIWEPTYECMSRDELQAIQFDRLQTTLYRVYEKVPFYRQLFDQNGITPRDIKSLEDVRKVPFTTKDALRDNYPYGMFAVPLKEIVRVHASSGTTGKPIVVGYTKRDIQTWSRLIARVVSKAGVTDEDVAQICFGYGLFTGGFGLHYGLEKVGATIIPASVGNTQKQIMLMQDFGTTVLVATPSYALYMAEAAEEMGIDTSTLNLRVGLFGAEPWTENMRQEIEQRWNIKATDNYGLSELMGPGVAGECLERKGLHIAEDHFLVEVIHPETGEPLDYGQEGELVFTTLTKEGFPVVRYRTRDISVLDPEPCACGRTTVRMGKVIGRTDDMLIIRGINVFPSQVESVLMEVQGVAPHYQLIVTKNGYLDDLEVQVELAEENFTDNYPQLKAIEDEIHQRFHNVLSIGAKIKLVAPKSIERSTGKAKRVVDLRPKELAGTQA
ncbi:MAG: phenylacetate--CoA ligase family protein [Thermincolia bacterium]